MDINQALVTMVEAELGPKKFSTGSKGFFATGKVTADGVRYQANAQAVLVGSKGNPRAKVEATTEEIAAALAAFVKDELAGRTFSTGRTGYRADGKIQAHGQRFQASAQAVRLS
jgi:hypothetical protein